MLLRVASAVLVLSGCSLVRAYPRAVDERDDLACHDGYDQDDDDRVDCEDPDCASACDESLACDDADDEDGNGLVGCLDPACFGRAECAEDLAALCADGRDNDLDGRTDARDAGCWPHARIEVERCASVLGGHVVLDPDDFAGGTMVPDAIGDGRALRHVPRATTSVTLELGDPTVRALDEATGAWDGTVVQLRAHAGGPGATDRTQLLITLRRSGATRMGAERIVVHVGASVRVLVLTAFGLAHDASASIGPVGDTRLAYDVTMRAVGSDVVLDVRRSDGRSATLTAPAPSTWGDAPSLELALEGSSEERTFLESATIDRPILVRCGMAQPPFGVRSRLGERDAANAALDAVIREPGGSLCAIATHQVGGRAVMSTGSWSSADEGRTWTAGAVIRGGVASDSALGDMWSLAVDPLTDRMHVLLVDPWGARLRVASGEGCADLGAPVDAGLDLAEGGALALGHAATEYRIDAEGHSVTVLGIDGAGPFLRTYRSPWGEPGTFVLAETDRSIAALPTDLATYVGPLLTLSRQGARVFFDDGARRAWVETREGPVLVPALARAASDEAATFDAIVSTGPAILLEDPVEDESARSWSGRLYHSGRYDVDPDTGWGFVRIAITPAEAP